MAQPLYYSWDETFRLPVSCRWYSELIIWCTLEYRKQRRGRFSETKCRSTWKWSTNTEVCHSMLQKLRATFVVLVLDVGIALRKVLYWFCMATANWIPFPVFGNRFGIYIPIYSWGLPVETSLNERCFLRYKRCYAQELRSCTVRLLGRVGSVPFDLYQFVHVMFARVAWKTQYCIGIEAVYIFWQV